MKADSEIRILGRITALTLELAEADRRAGAAERQNAQLLEDTQKRTCWLDAAKDQAGYDRNISFDVVWDETLKKALAFTGVAASTWKTAPILQPTKGADILPCPFCGSKAEGAFRGRPFGANATAVCCSNSDCIAHGKQVSIEKWQTRVGPLA